MTSALIFLIVLYFVTSAIGTVTGSNSLITVPIMFQLGISEKEAVATNMFGLVFMSIGASIPFVRAGTVDVRRALPLIGLTIVGSTLGALLVGVISNAALRYIVSIAMIGMVLFTIFGRRRKALEGAAMRPGSFSFAAGIALAFLLAIYGGLYSGGYVTVLTAVCVAFFGLSYAGAIAVTKVINVFSSAVAAAVFMWQGLVNYRLGSVLAVTMFCGAYIGGHYASRLNEQRLRQIFMAAIILLALKTLFDLAYAA